MDILRDPKPKKKKRIIQGVVVAGVLILGFGSLRSLKPAAPSVDRATVWMDTVQRGTMVRQVRGPGTLVPEQMRWITAVTAGRVEERIVLPGTEVTSETIILRMSNPDVEVQMLQAQQQMSQAEANLISLRSTLANQRLTQQGLVAQTRTLWLEAKRVYETNKALYDKNPELVAGNELARTKEAAEELETRLALEKERLDVVANSIGEQLSAQQRQVDRLGAVAQFNVERVASMVVRAGVDGVLAEMPLQEGQWAIAGATLARVVQPGRLKAELRIPQTQAQDIVVGQVSFIDTRNDTIEGRVTRIDPAVQNGTVTVDVALQGGLPRGARPDLSVDGTVELERLEDVLHVGRPAFGQEDSTVGLFRLSEDEDGALRTQVRLGRTSVNLVEIQGGLAEGDQVILSDMSAWDAYDRVRLN